MKINSLTKRLVLGTLMCLILFNIQAQKIVIDWSTRYQKMDGFGAFLYPYNGTSANYYAKNTFLSDYYTDLGSSMVRIELHPSFCPDSLSLSSMENYNNYKISLSKNYDSIFKALKNLVLKDPTIKVIATVWSPPGWMKTNNSPTEGGALKPACYPHFARFLYQHYKFIQDKYGVSLFAISTQNELRFKEPYNSCIYTPATYKDMMAVVGEYFESKSCPVKFFGPEDMSHVPEMVVSFVRPIMTDVKTKKYLHYVASHGYIEGISSVNGDPSISMALYKACSPYGLPQWMTETSGEHFEWDDSLAFNSSGKPLKGALSGLGFKMHVSMVYGFIQGWTYWAYAAAGASSSYNFTPKDKKYCVQKHYSKYVRPGAFRIDASPDGVNNVWVSAYHHPENKKLTVVILNMSRQDQNVELQLKYGMKVSSFQCYQTRRYESFEDMGDITVNTSTNSVKLLLSDRSVTTLYATCDSGNQGTPPPAPVITCNTDSKSSSSTIYATLTIDKNFGYWSTNGPDGPYNKFDMTYNKGKTTIAFQKTDTLWFYASDGVSSTPKSSRIYTITSALQDNENSSRVYPNPANDFIKVHLCETSDILLFDVQGKLLNLLKNKNDEVEIDISKLSSGTYFLRIGSNEKAIVYPIIKQ